MKASDRIVAELRDIDNLPDADIDTSDIPEKLDWTDAVRGRFHKIRTLNRELVPLTVSQKFEIRRLITAGTSSARIAAEMGIFPAQVRAIKAHMGMSTYDKWDKGNTDAPVISSEWLRRLQARTKRNADKREIEFKLLPGHTETLFEQQKGRCAVSV